MLVEITAAAALYLVQEQAPTLSLACFGNGSKTETSASSSSNEYGSSASSATARKVFSDQVDVRVRSTAASIRIPRGMLPMAYGGDQDGWWQIKDLKMTNDAITGHVSLNFMNKPKVRIDRRSGHISIDGSAHFAGMCEVIDSEQRKF